MAEIKKWTAGEIQLAPYNTRESYWVLFGDHDALREELRAVRSTLMQYLRGESGLPFIEPYVAVRRAVERIDAVLGDRLGPDAVPPIQTQPTEVTSWHQNKWVCFACGAENSNDVSVCSCADPIVQDHSGFRLGDRVEVMGAPAQAKIGTICFFEDGDFVHVQNENGRFRFHHETLTRIDES